MSQLLGTPLPANTGQPAETADGTAAPKPQAGPAAAGTGPSSAPADPEPLTENSAVRVENGQTASAGNEAGVALSTETPDKSSPPSTTAAADPGNEATAEAAPAELQKGAPEQVKTDQSPLLPAAEEDIPAMKQPAEDGGPAVEKTSKDEGDGNGRGGEASRPADAEQTGSSDRSGSAPSQHQKNGEQQPVKNVSVHSARSDGGESRGAEQAGPAAQGRDFASAVQQQQEHAAPPVPSARAGTVDTPAVGRTHSGDPLEHFEHAATISRGGTRLAVQLEPDGLGKLDINLSLDKGMVNAHIRASDDGTRSLLESNMPRIMDALAKEGLSVGGFSVALQQHGSGTAWENTLPGETGDAGGAVQQAAPDPLRPQHPGLVNIFI